MCIRNNEKFFLFFFFLPLFTFLTIKLCSYKDSILDLVYARPTPLPLESCLEVKNNKKLRNKIETT